MKVSLEIDKFTPCLVERKSGNIVQTCYSLATKADLKNIKWKFKWNTTDLSNSEIYKLTLVKDKEIQGLVAIENYPSNYAIYLKLAESAPHNLDVDKKYEGVGGHLFAIAVQKSIDRGYGGFVYFEAKNQSLVKHYQEKFGAKIIGGVHQYRMIIDEEAAERLLKKYNFEEGK